MATGGRVTGVHNVMTGKKLADRWHVLEMLGGGGMGVVYRGWDLKLKAHVAIKVLNNELRGDPSIVKRFSEEIDTLKRSAHPNIAIIHDFSTTDIIYLVLEFLDGTILKIALDESPGRRMHPQRIRRIFTQILDALAVVHERGIIHRDLKPENVFVLRLGSGRRNTDVVKLIDFGIAKFRGGPPGTRPGLTQVGTVLGTPLYMSPEQCRGEIDVDQRTDIYAVGVMLYEAATGRLPFSKPTNPEIMTAHLNDCPDAPCMINPKISPELEMVILRALAKKPEDRFQDAVEFSEALEAAIPEDKSFYRDSQRVSPVNGRAMTTPPRVPVVAEDEQPTAERQPPEPAADLSKTPTRKLEGERPALGIALDKTITPIDLDKEIRMSSAGQVREVSDTAAVDHLKMFGVWIGRVPRRTIAIAAGCAIFTTVALIILAALLSDGNSKRTSATTRDAGVESTAANHRNEERDVPDVIVVPVPMPLPPPVATGVPDATADERDAAETALSVGPPNGYADLLAAAKRARNWRTTVSRLEEATRLWPEGPDAWEELGNVFMMHGKIREAKEAFRKCISLLPPDAFVQRARVEGRLRGLR
ncbi:MAG: protein kinase [Patescibacteria group bacterium]